MSAILGPDQHRHHGAGRAIAVGIRRDSRRESGHSRAPCEAPSPVSVRHGLQVHARSGLQQVQHAFGLKNMHARPRAFRLAPGRPLWPLRKRAATRAPQATVRWSSGRSKEWRRQHPPASRTRPLRRPALPIRANRSAGSPFRDPDPAPPPRWHGPAVRLKTAICRRTNRKRRPVEMIATTKAIASSGTIFLFIVTCSPSPFSGHRAAPSRTGAHLWLHAS